MRKQKGLPRTQLICTHTVSAQSSKLSHQARSTLSAMHQHHVQKRPSYLSIRRGNNSRSIPVSLFKAEKQKIKEDLNSDLIKLGDSR
jgi:hypothetical protein